MWLTGFDAPSLHTMYVDKPVREHGLMQALASWCIWRWNTLPLSGTDAPHQVTLERQTRRVKPYGIGLRAATIPGDPAAVECVPDSSRRVFL
jgi:hypothetical protein